MLILYHFEQCPFCQKVRTFLSDNGIDYMSVPVPKDRQDKRKILEQLGGKQMVPFLIDTQAGESMYESDDIIAHVEKNYV